MQVILASSSPYRQAQLEALGLKFTCVRPTVDESNLKKQLLKSTISPQELAMQLGYAKAQSVQALSPQAVVIGSDQLAVLEGKILGKTADAEQCFQQLKMMNGRTHQLITSLIVLSPSQEPYRYAEIVEITMRRLSDPDLRAYVERDQPMDCAGSYKIEKAGMALVEKMVARDPSSIQGLPLIALTTQLQHILGRWPFAKGAI